MLIINEENRKCLSLVYNRSIISKRGTLIKDPQAEKIAECIDNSGNKMTYNKYLSLFLGIRARILDDLADAFIKAHPDCVVLHLGCGLDSRCMRLSNKPKLWVDLDFAHIIQLRKQFYTESDSYRMIASDVSDLKWLDTISEHETALIVAEGLSMFLTAEENINLFAALRDKFYYCEYFFDAYTDRAVLYSAKNEVPIRGKTVVWGLSNPQIMENIGGVKFIKAYHFNYSKYIRSFGITTMAVYRLIYGRHSTNRLYRIYQYKISRNLELLK